jgi:uncharacterized protein YndB with AHSA1/START domain
MNNEEALQLLDQELADYRRRAYAELVDLIAAGSQAFERSAPSGVTYQIEILVVWDGPPGGGVCVIGSVDDGGWRAFLPLGRSFIKRADGTFVGESLQPARTREAQPVERLRVHTTVGIAAPPEAAWTALTEPAELQIWYAPGCRWEVPSLAEGSTVRFFNTDTDVQSATIERAIHARELALLWQADPSMPSVRLLNRFVLEPVEGGTRVVITQEGYEALPAEERPAWMRQDEGAYAAVADRLKRHVEASSGLRSN